MRAFFESSYFIIAFLICLSSGVYTVIWGRTDRAQNKLYLFLLIDVAISALAGLMAIVVMPYCPDYSFARHLKHLAHLLYFIFHTLLSPMFFIYIIYVTGAIHRYRRHRKLFAVMMCPVLLVEIMVILNPFTHRVYHLDENFVFFRGEAETFVYLSSALYFILAIADMLHYWKVVSFRRRTALLFLFVISFAGILAQMLDQHLLVELFAEALALMTMMLAVENEDDRIDTSTNLYNRSALNDDAGRLIYMKQPFYVIVTRVSNADALKKLTGSSNSDTLLDSVADYFKSIHPRYQIYKTSPTTFVLLQYGGDHDEARLLADQIWQRFEENWNCEGVEIRLGASVMMAYCPDEVRSAEEIFLMTDTPEPPEGHGGVREGEELAYLHRSIEVEQALRRGFDEHQFEVYYQPTYYLDTMDIHSAEALIRLHDNKLGDIPPGEFIPVAERNGMIDEIGRFVLEETCLFLSSGLPVEMGIEYISINLSVMQCLQQGFIRYVKELISRYDIPASLISFEIKESAAVADYHILETLITELRSYGFRFSMDSYGTGFSDMQSVFALDLDTIKIDRAVLYKAQENRIGRIILENIVHTIREMHRKSLVEGVETQAQLDLLKKLGVDYVQGYFSSKPITRNELLGILRFTELARMEERRATAASEAKSSFLANMSHEIRTPINAVLGMNEMILRECQEDHVMGYAREIEAAGRNLLSLINNILDYSKIEAGDMEIVEADYDLGVALSDVVRGVYRKFASKGLSFSVEVAEDVPQVFFGDEFRIKQILTNLLNNAIKFTTEGGAVLSVSCESAEADEMLLSFSVRDTGCGIREEDLGRLFQRFERLNTDKNLTIAGGGLGLAISYHLLQMMSGEIAAESEYGKGSTFTVRMLQRVIDTTPIGDFHGRYLKGMDKENSREREAFTAPTAYALIVDDTPMNHLVMRELLKTIEIKIDTADSGEEAIEKAAQRHYDILFIDEKMPGMSGRETLHAIREAEGPNRHTPAISLTANDYAGIREEMKEEGFEDFLTKPVDSELLEDLLYRYLPEGKVFV